MRKIASGYFTGVVHHADRYYAVSWSTRMLYIYEFTNRWNQCSSFQIESSKDYNLITLCISNDSLYVCTDVDDRVDIYSLSGHKQSSFGKEGSGEAGLVNRPFIAASDTGGAALIADCNNRRLHVLSARRQWSIVQLEPAVSNPYGALLVGGKLYVNEYVHKSLHMYEAE